MRGEKRERQFLVKHWDTHTQTVQQQLPHVIKRLMAFDVIDAGLFDHFFFG
jgi:hypothetical protein